MIKICYDPESILGLRYLNLHPSLSLEMFFLLFKTNQKDHKVNRSTREKYEEDYKINLLGDTMLNMNNQSDIRTVFDLDGSKPTIPGVDNFTKL